MTKIIEYLNKQVVVTEVQGNVLGKTCSCCKQFKVYTEFHTRFADGKNYLFSICKECNKASLKKTRGSNKQLTLYYGCKHRATRQGLEFSIDKEDIIIPEYCPILGIRLSKGFGVRDYDSPTVDRVDNSKGYTKDNIVVCSWRANKLKSNASLEEVEKIYFFMKNF